MLHKSCATQITTIIHAVELAYYIFKYPPSNTMSLFVDSLLFEFGILNSFTIHIQHCQIGYMTSHSMD